jgi:TRAP-type C4-dicarboxylate transport system substrate-binding protein
VKTLGAVPVTMTAPDTYQALERGVVDGTVFPWEAIAGFKLAEVTRFHTIANLYVTTFFFTMNRRRCDGLPLDLRKVIDDLGGAWGAEFTGAAWDRGEEEGIAAARKAGSVIYALPPAEQARWVQKARLEQDEWVSRMEARGLPGRRVLADLRDLARKFDP